MSENSTEPRRTGPLLLTAAAGMLAAGVGIYAVVLGTQDPEPCSNARLGASLGGPLSLVDHAGAPHNTAAAGNGPTLVYFGYTYCPDVCPLDVARVSDAVHLLDQQGITVTPVFVTIDPARDTPEILQEFMEPFHPRMLGLTGSAEEIAAAAKAWRVYYAKASGDPENYLMDHSALTYLADREGAYVAHFSHATPPEAIVEGVACHARAGRIAPSDTVRN